MASQSISKEDKANIEKLREAVKNELTPYYDTDFNLLRWLQGYNNNLDSIIPRLKSHLRFRRSAWDLDHLADKPRNHPLHAHWKTGLTGEAIKTPNTIVNIEQSGRNDYWGMLLTYSITQIMKARLHDLETMLRQVNELERRTGQQCFIMYIMDLTDLKYDKRLLNLITGALSSISAFMSEHYVEMIHTFVLVNTPPFIATVWAIVKPLLPERTREKVRILGSNWKCEVQNIAVPDVLPTFWNDEKIQLFKAELELAKPLDPKGYYQEKMDECAKLLSVRPGKTGSIDIEANKGSVIRWCIHADGHFGYTLYYAENQSYQDPNLLTNIYPIFTKIPGPTMVPIEDKLQCDKDGIYKFWFSNEHAWLHTLNIRYHIIME